MPFGIDLPGSSAKDDSGGGGASEDFDSALKSVDELSGKLEEKEKLIYGMLSKAIPKVEIPMPKLSESMFGGGGGGEKEPLLAAPGPGSTPDVPVVEGTSKAKLKAKELQKKKAEAQKNAEEAQRQMAEDAKEAMKQQASSLKQSLTQAFAAAMSVAVGVGMSFAPFSAFLGQVLAGVAAALLNFLGLAISWKNRSNSIFQVISKVFDKMTSTVVTVLDTVDDMIMGPLEKLENAIEDMCEEQKPNLDKMKQMESTMKMVKPDFDMPDPEDLKKPLDGADDLIDEFVDKAKKEIPDKITEMVQSTTIGRIATSESSFNLYTVTLPLSVVLLFNMILVVAQVWFMFTPEDAESEPSDDLASSSISSRLLRGSNATGPLQDQMSKMLGINETGFVPESFGNFTKLPKTLTVGSVMPYIQPALVQIVLAALQMVAAFILSSGPRICALVNDAIADFGKKINDRINNRIKTAVDKVFGEAFKEVKAKSDKFFPKFKDALGTLKKALETAGKAGAMAGAAANAAKGIGSMF